MPTWDKTERFDRDYARLSPPQRAAFKRAAQEFRAGLAAGQFVPWLRVKKMREFPNVWEMAWERRDGRATFEYGNPPRPGDHHVTWRRIGTHAIYENP